ncbi:MAG: TlpA family protein disulfide reductase [Myxococcales bacterium FL481]|nr:MAG: TlpA family protein disulfide reductase [Myxococcales bacterium FL481]
MRSIGRQLTAALCLPSRLVGEQPVAPFGLVAFVVYLVTARLHTLAEGLAAVAAVGGLPGLVVLLQSAATAVLPFAVTWIALEYVLGRSQLAWRGVLMWPFVLSAAAGHAAIVAGLWPQGTSVHVSELIGALWSMVAALRIRRRAPAETPHEPRSEAASDPEAAARSASVSQARLKPAAASEVLPRSLPMAAHAVAWLSLTALVSSALVSGYDVWQRRDQFGPRGRGETMAAFAVPTLAGERFDRSVLDNRVTLLAFWATYCGACTAEMPALKSIAERYAGRSVTVVGVNQDFDPDQRSLAREYRRMHDLRFPIALDDGQLARMLRVSRIPHIVVLDGDGVIRRVFQGRVSEDTLADAVDDVLASGPVKG